MNQLELLLMQSMISDDPLEVRTHYIMVTTPNFRGQARYKCLKCAHEFECTGRSRLIHHITGTPTNGANSRYVRYCPHPHEPLKQNLLKELESNHKPYYERHNSTKKRPKPEDEEKLQKPPEENNSNLSEGNPQEYSQSVEVKQNDSSTIPTDQPSGDVKPTENVSSTTKSPSMTKTPRVRMNSKESGPNAKRLKVGRRPRILEETTSLSFGLSKASNDKLLHLLQTIYQLAPDLVEKAMLIDQLSGSGNDPNMTTLYTAITSGIGPSTIRSTEQILQSFLDPTNLLSASPSVAFNPLASTPQTTIPLLAALPLEQQLQLLEQLNTEGDKLLNNTEDKSMDEIIPIFGNDGKIEAISNNEDEAEGRRSLLSVHSEVEDDPKILENQGSFESSKCIDPDNMIKDDNSINSVNESPLATED